MSNRNGPVYEATFFIDPAAVEDFEAWLKEETDRICLRDGVAAYRLLSLPDNASGQAVRLCQFDLVSDADAARFPGPDSVLSETALPAPFEEHVACHGRLLTEDVLATAPPEHSPDCLNCGDRLRGQYCGTCGQRSRSRLISLWELISDAFGDLFELDSRLWQTLVPLIVRPGRLTYDYLQGRRARFMPPFRMYLVLSLVFFLVAFADPSAKFGVFFEPVPSVATTGTGTYESDLSVATTDAVDHELDCDVDQSDIDDLPDWVARRLTIERLKQICERVQLDDGRAFLDEIVDTIPTALIVLLPFIAFVLTVLYPLSRRFYVEHLLFLVHFHAFFFLLLTLQILFARIASLFGLPDIIATLALVATSVYLPAYLFVAMRKVYGQSRFATFLKYGVLTFAYVLGLTVTMLIAALLAALSI